MKVRLTNEQIRLRLAEDDVRCLSDGSSVNTSIDLGAAGRINWTLEARTDVTEVGVSLLSTEAIVVIPAAWITALRNGVREGINAEIPSDASGQVSVLIETDLPCRHPATKMPD